jgi:hypothetical protein
VTPGQSENPLPPWTIPLVPEAQVGADEELRDARDHQIVATLGTQVEEVIAHRAPDDVLAPAEVIDERAADVDLLRQRVAAANSKTEVVSAVEAIAD